MHRTQVRLLMTLPPGWAAIDVGSLRQAIDEGFVLPPGQTSPLMDQLGDLHADLVGVSWSPLSGRPEALIAATVIPGVGDDERADTMAPQDGDEGITWSVQQVDPAVGVGSADSIVRASYTWRASDAPVIGVVATYVVAFTDAGSAVSIVALAKVDSDAEADALDLFDLLAASATLTTEGPGGE